MQIKRNIDSSTSSECIPAAIQQEEIDMVEERVRNNVHVTRIKTGHCPNFTALDEKVNWIVDLAESVQ